MDFTDTYYMIAALKELPLEHTFFKSRYFPTNTAMDVFGTAKVLADYAKGNRKLAPFVLPRIGGISVAREGFSTYELEPANISISMPLTADQLNKRGFGEALLSDRTPEDRARLLMVGDLAELSGRISRTEEKLAIDTILDNGTVMCHQAETPEIYEDIPVRFYEGENNPAIFTPAKPWTHGTATEPGNWFSDIRAMITMLTRRGLPARELLVSSDVGEFLMHDPWIIAMLDNRRVEIGRLDPTERTEWVTSLGVFNFIGRNLEILICDGTYEDANGNDTPYIPDGTAIVIAPDVGKGLYGAVTQLESDGQYHTYAGTRVPQHIFTVRPPVKETQLTCRPLFVPKRPSPWTVAKNVFDT